MAAFRGVHKVAATAAFAVGPTLLAVGQAVVHDRTYVPLPNPEAVQFGRELPKLAREKLQERAEALRAQREAFARRLATERESDAPVVRAARRWLRDRAAVCAAPAGERRPAAAAGPSVEAARRGTRCRVLFIGDSLVTGVGGSAERARSDGPPLPRRVCRNLADRMGVEVEWRALGETGCDVEGIRRRLVPSIAHDSYDVVVLMCGLNDFKRIARGELRTPWAFARDLERLVADIRASVGDECEIVMPALPVAIAAFPEPMRSYVVFIATQWDRQKALLASEIARLKRGPVRFVSVFESPRSDLTASDNVHPNESGYELWAAHIAAQLLKDGDVRTAPLS